VGVWECGSVGVWECGSVGVWELGEEKKSKMKFRLLQKGYEKCVLGSELGF
jgi:hypothetical protein